MKKIIFKPLFWIAFSGIWISSCSDSFLNVPPKGALGTEQLLSQAGVENLLIGAYSALKANSTSAASIGSWSGNATNWVYGSVCGQETFKGSNSGDQSDINPLSTFTAPSTNSYLVAKWGSVYDGVNRSNLVIKTLNKVTEGISDADRARIMGEARFLRGFFHLEARKVFGKVPYVDETIDYALNNFNLPNDADILPMIIADFDFAYNNLPETMSAVGRANKWAAYAFEGKCLVYQGKFADALPILTKVITDGKTAAGTSYGLLKNYRDVFDASHDNSVEAVFAIQGSVNDGSGAANADAELVLNYPYGGNSVVTCCGFNTPTLDLANSYRLNASGLPILDGTFNSAANQISDVTWATWNGDTLHTPSRDLNPIDPRIDWTMGRTGVPFLDWSTYTGPAWVRSFVDDGPYTPKKYDPLSADVGTYTDKSSWTPGYTAVNMYLMRYADVLLLAAECEVEAGSIGTAMGYVNMLRARQMTPASWVKISKQAGKTDWQAYTDPTVTSIPAGNYTVALYDATSFGAQANARKAVHMERKLELALEGHRFFDLVRWGEIFKSNTTNPDCLEAAYLYNVSLSGSAALGTSFNFVAGKSEYFPIPQNQIDLSQGVLKQNNGY